ncbi:MAG TPA: STAS domain-containing protein [Rubrivivax sp.]|jgi:phospholipid transport system transporter-binding protein|nr:STAS domain-containing protein [Rubrivivax sp.]
MKLPARATLDEAAALLAMLENELAGAGQGEVFELDASALQEVDSSALALMIEAHRLCAQRGLRFRASGLPAKLSELARLYGVESLLSPVA